MQKMSHSASSSTLTNEDKDLNAPLLPALQTSQHDFLAKTLSVSQNLRLNPATSPLLVHHQLDPLPYQIDSWSSYSAQYHPRNILVNSPTDQSSRWSSGSNNQAQFIMLALEKESIVHTITFGKYHKVHVCNLKEFKVYGGLTQNNMVEILHSGLRNDSEAETFPLKYKSDNVLFPVKFIKIAPLMAWGQNFNFSIWHVELRGVGDQELVRRTMDEYLQHRESEAIRVCLKHFRQRNLMATFNTLQSQTNLTLEHPMLTQLHKNLVLDGDFAATERVIQEASKAKLFGEFIAESKYTPVWKRILATDSNGDAPCMRGGHQMCIDDESGIIYVLGGWDGKKDLADFWSYNIHTESWTCISQDTKKEGGPGPRSCHKICFDSKTNSVYVLGRYIDPQSRATTSTDSDFYRFDCRQQLWIKISDNVQAQNGPELIYDHQMCIDSENQVLYVFGGRIISSTPNLPTENSYSGLYSYNMNTDVWRLLRSDTSLVDGAVQLKSRIGHSMLFHPRSRQLFIFAGQRLKDYLSDYYVYDIDADKVIEMNRDSSKNGGPDAGFTQRATIDVEKDEFYVFSGLMREKNSSTETVKNSFWVYSISKDKWHRIYQNENVGDAYWKEMEFKEPCPRFAHQLAYDSKRRVQYLFGGNPGDHVNMTLRLDDFWSLNLVKPKAVDVARNCTFLIRKQKFRELCIKSVNTLDALKYLQNEVSAAVSHSNEKESLAFRALTANLFQTSEDAKDAGSRDNVFKMRTELYEMLLDYFPESMKQPKGNLVDLIKA